jgi:hypothetical protein
LKLQMQEAGVASEQGMANAARPQGETPMPSMPGLSREGGAPTAGTPQ